MIIFKNLEDISVFFHVDYNTDLFKLVFDENQFPIHIVPLADYITYKPFMSVTNFDREILLAENDEFIVTTEHGELIYV